MLEIADQGRIIDRRDLAVRAAALVRERELSGAALNAALLDELKAALQSGHAEVRGRFEAGAGGTEVVHANCLLVDGIIRTIHDFAEGYVYPMSNPTAGERLCLVAVGGYGRGELAPFSDVDLLFLFPYKQTPHGEQLAEYMLYLLWDLGLKVGHATRSIDQCLRHARDDNTILTTLLEARYLCGDMALFAEFRQRFEKEVLADTGPAFAEAKLAERDERHRRMGDSRYVLEPNIKDGKGGLRDLHTLFWLAKHFYRVDKVEDLVERGVLTAKEAANFARAQNFLWTLRCHLHYLTDRAEERLTFDLQPEIGRRMGYTDHAGTRGVERFMKHYFLFAKEVGDLTRIFCAAIEAETKRPQRFSFRKLGLRKRLGEDFALEGDRLTVTRDTVFAEDPINLLRLFHLAHAHDLDIHPRALKLVTRNLKLIDAELREDPDANRLFMEMLTSSGRSPAVALRRMSEAGVLGRFIPDFGRVVAQMQYDMYHVYTVDEHSIRAIDLLYRVEQGELAEDHPLATELMPEVSARRALYLAVLLHDIAKGRGRSHSELGAEIALKLGPRLGLGGKETETAAWLVRRHLLMSDTAQRRDIEDPKTVSDFAAAVGSLERLGMLLVLTVVDMRATGPRVWNGWKAALLRHLYASTADCLAGVPPAARRQVRVKAAHEALRKELADWSDAEFSEYAARNYYGYWLGLDTAAHVRHARMVREADREGRPLTVETRVDRDRAVTEITVYTPDHPGLFSKIAGAIAVSGGNIVDAKIFTMTNGMALDSFWVQDVGHWAQDTGGGPFEGRERLAALAETTERALAGAIRLDRELAAQPSQLPTRTRVFRVAPRVQVDNEASGTHTVLEVSGRDRPRLLYDVTRTLSGLGLQITSAKIATYGERAVDVFYVKDVFGLKIEHEGKVEQIREALLAVLAEPGAGRPEEEVSGPPARPPRRVREPASGENGAARPARSGR
jgi:[protein-PII] uridylyltransferase